MNQSQNREDSYMTASKDILADRYSAKSSIHENAIIKKISLVSIIGILYFLDLNCLPGFVAARGQ